MHVKKRQSEYHLINLATFIIVPQFVAFFCISKSRLFESYICTFTLEVWKEMGGSV